MMKFKRFAYLLICIFVVIGPCTPIFSIAATNLNVSNSVRTEISDNQVEGLNIIVVAQDLEDLPTLVEYFVPDAHIIFFDPLLDTPEAIIQKIETVSVAEKLPISTISILSRSDNKGFWLGNKLIEKDNLEEYEASFLSLRRALGEGACLYLYGATLGSNEESGKFLFALSELLGSKVYASANATGKDGDWILEIGSHPEDYTEALDSDALANVYYYNL
jgi:hypothetical protein